MHTSFKTCMCYSLRASNGTKVTAHGQCSLLHKVAIGVLTWRQRTNKSTTSKQFDLDQRRPIIQKSFKTQNLWNILEYSVVFQTSNKVKIYLITIRSDSTKPFPREQSVSLGIQATQSSCKKSLKLWCFRGFSFCALARLIAPKEKTNFCFAAMPFLPPLRLASQTCCMVENMNIHLHSASSISLLVFAAHVFGSMFLPCVG